MLDQAKMVVTNTTPLIALTAATGSLEVLRALYERVVVPYEVMQEIKVGGVVWVGYFSTSLMVGDLRFASRFAALPAKHT